MAERRLDAVPSVQTELMDGTLKWQAFFKGHTIIQRHAKTPHRAQAARRAAPCRATFGTAAAKIHAAASMAASITSHAAAQELFVAAVQTSSSTCPPKPLGPTRHWAQLAKAAELSSIQFPIGPSAKRQALSSSARSACGRPALFFKKEGDLLENGVQRATDRHQIVFGADDQLEVLLGDRLQRESKSVRAPSSTRLEGCRALIY